MRRSARLDIIVDAQGPDTLLELLFLELFLEGDFALSLDFSLALAIGSLGLFKNAKNVLALGVDVSKGVIGSGSSGLSVVGRTLLTTLPDLLMTVIVSPTPIATVGGLGCGCVPAAGCKWAREVCGATRNAGLKRYLSCRAV